MRGRLINPMTVELAQLDTYLTAKDPDGAGPLRAGYDDDFREPVLLPSTAGQGAAIVNRKEKPFIKLPAQVEVIEADKAREFAGGNAPVFEMRLTFHYRDLECRDLVDPQTGEALLRIGDRLHAIWSPCATRVVRTIRTPPGLYFVEVQDQSFGLSSRTRNLLIVRLAPRDQGVAT